MSSIYEGWAVVEMMGHRKFAGKLSPVEGFTGLLRLDIPGAESPVIIGAGAIFQITPVSEEFAVEAGKPYLESSSWGASHLRALLPGDELELLEAPDADGDYLDPDDDGYIRF